MKTLLMMSLTGSLLALIVMAVRAVFGKRLHPRVVYALWLAVALALLVPIRLQSRVSVMNVPQVRTFEQMVSARMDQPLGYGVVTGLPINGTVQQPSAADAPTRAELENPQPTQSMPIAPTTFALDLWDVLGIVWAAGAVVSGLYVLMVNLRFRGRVRRSRRAAAVPWVMQRRLRNTQVYVSRAVPSPCLVGLFHPFIVVTPQAMEEDERLCHVLTHELMHRRQGDPFWSVVRTAVLILHWFNPIVWIAASLSRADCENACDALTIRELGEESRVNYGKTLLAFLRARPTATGLVNTATTMAQSRRQIRRRISLIAKKRRYTLLIAVLCVALVLTGCAVTMTTASGDKTDVQTPVVDESDETLPMSDAQRRAFDRAKREALEQGDPYRYAETDVDADGSVELILLCDAEMMAGQSVRILAYDEETDALREQLNEYPLLTFYGNGVVMAGWSHSQGLAGDVLWPYTLYRYNSAADTYVQIAMVDAWEKKLMPDGYPAQADPEDTGAVYFIMSEGVYDLTHPVSEAEYTQWLEEMVGDAAEIEIQFRDLTVADVGEMPEEPIPGGELRSYIELFEAAVAPYASGFANMSEEEARAALPEMEDFVLYGRENGAGDAYIVAVLQEAPSDQAVVSRYLRISQVSSKEDGVTTEIEQYGKTESDEAVLLRSYSINRDVYVNNVNTGSAQDNALVIVLEGSAQEMFDLSGQFAAQRELYARSIGLTAVKPHSTPYLTIPMQTVQSMEQTGYVVSMNYYAPMSEETRTQLQQYFGAETSMEGVDLSSFWARIEYVTMMQVYIDEEEQYQLCSDGLLHYRNNEPVGWIENREAVDWLRSLVRDTMGYDLLEYPERWKSGDDVYVQATLQFPDHQGELHTQTIEDAQSLEKLANLVRESNVLYGGSGCPFDGVLTMQTQNGETITMFAASDSCGVLSSQGMIYLEYGDQQALFELFPECDPYYGSEEQPAQLEILPAGALEWIILADADQVQEAYAAVLTCMQDEGERTKSEQAIAMMDFRTAETRQLLSVAVYSDAIEVAGRRYPDASGTLMDWIEKNT